LSQSPPTPQQAKVLSTARAMYLAADGVPPTQPLGMSELRPSRDLVTRTMTALSVAGALPLAEEWGRLLRGEA
jgi:hypothetical protein